ncbi:MAG: hypothetical protein HYT80_09290 [Euryarchaeota archaeon]|nr:hypothetical protein [Euryarchaeota archaeon]
MFKGMAAPDPPPRDHDVTRRMDTFLGEFRMIIPAMAAVFGFQLIAAFQPTFERLAWYDRAANFAGLACTALAILSLLVPASYHRLSARLEETEEFLRFARSSIGLAFVFMPLAFSLSMYVQALRTFGSHPAAAMTGLAFFGAFYVGWWVVPRRRFRQAGGAGSGQGLGTASSR